MLGWGIPLANALLKRGDVLVALGDLLLSVVGVALYLLLRFLLPAALGLRFACSPYPARLFGCHSAHRPSLAFLVADSKSRPHLIPIDAVSRHVISSRIRTFAK